ncbi:CPBP family intramembrane glutamic endopeptidase [Dactylosporangium sp. AC04546]|uniref:CPBP family intramembrane glutamic endopeptidase n=1 Tax=Dactylosporangium sp. AC04546 TaxID=2862460 RepID=UPI001EDFA6F2|nr:CPBP family intramembrane glutamic endopeptidase [Dactylosporangium sp. AC04546]WVK83303.1 CPBP family intramembrane glutamic endopeptidase [Dactylosporangium sp. AC04546]
MTETLIRTRVPAPPTRRFGWPATLALHLLPSAATFAVAMALGPVMRSLDLPPQFALTLAFAFVLTPIELAVLFHATGARSVRDLFRSLPFQRKLPLRLYAITIPSLIAVAVGLVMLLEPLERAIRSAYPSSWLLPEDSTAFPTATMVATLLFALLVDGLVNPAVEELYFRAHLLPRLPVRGALAVATSAALFAAQHYWQPEKFLFIFLAQLLLTAVMVRLNSIRLSIAVHCASNSLAILLALAAVLS